MRGKYKVIIGILILVLVFALTGCGESEEKTETKVKTPKISGEMTIATGSNLGSKVLEKLPSDYKVSTFDSAEKVNSQFADGKVDAAIVSSIDALNLYSKTGGDLLILSPTSLGGIKVIYNSTNDTEGVTPNYLSPRTVYSLEGGKTAQGVLEALVIADGGIIPEYKVEETDQDITKRMGKFGAYGLAMEPLASSIVKEDKNVKVLFDVDELWKTLTNVELPTNVLIIRKSMKENREEDVKALIYDYEQAFSQTDDKEYLVFYGSSNRGKEILEKFYDEMLSKNPEAIGEKVPDDIIYYDNKI